MIVHIGLGKTGTTSLQRAVFPRLLDEGILEQYNPPHIMRALRRFAITGEGDEELKEELLKLPEKTLISLESLAGWNPAVWQINASKNAYVFPDSATILISLRDVEEYLTSVYIQMLHQGSVVKPEHFILSDSDYDVIAPFSRPLLCEIFKVDDLDYEHLVKLYEVRFRKVVIVPISKLAGLGFLEHLFELPEVSMYNLRQQFLSSTKENISYSRRAIRLTFFRERLISHLGLKSKSSLDRFFEEFSGFSNKIPSPGNVKRRNFLIRILIKIRNRLSWRYLMQQLIDRFFMYTKYQLPDSIPRGKKLNINRAFYKHLTEIDCGYLIVESKKVDNSQNQPVTYSSVD